MAVVGVAADGDIIADGDASVDKGSSEDCVKMILCISESLDVFPDILLLGDRLYEKTLQEIGSLAAE